MQIFNHILKGLIIVLCVLLACDQVDLNQRKKSDVEPTLSLDNLTKFTYVAIKHMGPYEDFGFLKEEFSLQIQKQQIIATGSPFVIYYNNPENTSPNNLEWEIGVPTVEGTMVKEPLTLKTWPYEKVAKVEQDVHIPMTSNIYPIIFEQISEKNLTYQGPTAVRILNDMDEDTVSRLKTEIWIPLASTSTSNQIAE